MTPPNEPPAEVNAAPAPDAAGLVPGHPRTTPDATPAPPSAPWQGSAPQQPPLHAPGPTGTPADAPQPPAGTTPPGGQHAPGAPQPPAPGTAATPPSGPQATRQATRPPRRRTQRIRTGLVVLGVLAAGVTVLAALNSGTRHGLLDPRSADPSGSRAVSELLKERGVTTRVVTTAREAAAATGPRTTLLVTDPDRLGATQRRQIAWASDLSGGRTILIGPTSHSLTELAYGVHTKGDADPKTLAPDCAFPAATTAGRAGLGDGLRYTTSAA
ncbi:DUF4350 domain-containing protein, partial [Streptomyces sp. NPDC059233]